MTSPEGPIEYLRGLIRRESATKQTKVTPKIIMQQSRAKVLFRFHLKAIILRNDLTLKRKRTFALQTLRERYRMTFSNFCRCK